MRFTLYKENCDTIEAISTIAAKLQLSSRYLYIMSTPAAVSVCLARVFGYAGTKDRRAVTAQEVTCFKVIIANFTNVAVALSNVITIALPNVIATARVRVMVTPGPDPT